MNKLIISLAFTITLPFFQVAVAQETDITETFLDTEITELQQNVCNSTVDSILLSNQPDKTALDDALVANSTGDYNVLTKSSGDDSYVLLSNTLSPTTTDELELDDDGVTVKVIDKTTVDTTIMADPNDPSTEDELTTNVCP